MAWNQCISRDLASRQFDRNEPLQFPNHFPFDGKTHCHGRWVQSSLAKNPVWVDYPDQDGDSLFVLPPNVPRDGSHWEFCTLPNGVHVRSMVDFITMVINWKTQKNIPFYPFDPIGPALHGTQGSYVINDKEAIDLVWDIGANANDNITPVPYHQPYSYPVDKSSLSTSPGKNSVTSSFMSAQSRSGS